MRRSYWRLLTLRTCQTFLEVLALVRSLEDACRVTRDHGMIMRLSSQLGLRGSIVQSRKGRKKKRRRTMSDR